MRCSGCAGSNVDFEGYCWTCEHQNAVPRPASGVGSPDPGGPVGASGYPGGPGPGVPVGVGAGAAPYPGVGVVEAPVHRGKVRLSAVVLPPLVTVLVLAAGLAGIVAFRWADGVVSAAPASADQAAEAAGSSTGAGGSGNDQGRADGCIVGTWKVTSIEENSKLDEFGMVHFTGGGGTLSFGADGAGSHNHAGMVENAQAGGRSITVSFAGARTFRYAVFKGMVTFEYVANHVTATVLVNNVRVAASNGAVPVQDVSYRLSCAGTSLTIEATNGAFLATRAG